MQSLRECLRSLPFGSVLHFLGSPEVEVGAEVAQRVNDEEFLKRIVTEKPPFIIVDDGKNKPRDDCPILVVRVLDGVR